MKNILKLYQSLLYFFHPSPFTLHPSPFTLHPSPFTLMPYLSTSHGKTLVALYIQPKASKNKFCGLHGGEMKLAITAPPVDGKANKAVMQFLAKFLGVAKSAITIQGGLQSRHKQVLVEGVSGDEVRDKIERVLG